MNDWYFCTGRNLKKFRVSSESCNNRCISSSSDDIKQTGYRLFRIDIIMSTSDKRKQMSKCDRVCLKIEIHEIHKMYEIHCLKIEIRNFDV